MISLKKNTIKIIFAFIIMILLAPGRAGAAGFEELYQQGMAAYKSGDFTNAGQHLFDAGKVLAASNDPRALLIWGNAGIAMMKANEYNRAAQLYDHLVSAKNAPRDKLKQYYHNLLVCREKLNEPALATSAAERMLKAVPGLTPADKAEVYARMGDAYKQLELYGPAANAFANAIKSLPKDARPEQRAKLYTALGMAQGNLGEYESAGQNLVEARKQAEGLGEQLTMAEADSNLGLLHWERGEYNNAMNLISAAYDRAKANANIPRRKQGVELNNLGLVNSSIGDYEKAMQNFEDSLNIAREEKNLRDQAIAMENMALIKRIAGKFMEAGADYKEAEKLMRQAGFKEGQASTMLGIGKMAEMAEKNYTQALENYSRALDIFQELDLPRWQAVTMLQLGNVHKKIATPGEKRTTRDLVFDEEPTIPDMPKNEALAKSRAYYEKCLEMAERLYLRELIWQAHQGLGFADYKEGKLESALDHYQKAINRVSKMRAKLEDVQKLGEYMAGKEELYNEAIAVCAELYKQTKDPKYNDLMLKLQSTLNNEVNKANTALVQMKFENKNKQNKYDEINTTNNKLDKYSKSLQPEKELPANATAEQKRQQEMIRKSNDEIAAQIKKLNGDLNKLLQEWSKEYPEDAAIFDATAKIDIPGIQKNLKDGQVVLQYISLPDEILINVIKKGENPKLVSTGITKYSLNEKIKKNFINDYLFEDWDNSLGKVKKKTLDYEKSLQDVTNTLSDLYKYLIAPVKNDIKGAERLYIINDGYLALLPYSALVSGKDEKGKPRFLVEDFEIGNLRPVFANKLAQKKDNRPVRKMLAVANATNKNFPMGQLNGAVEEIKLADKHIKGSNRDKVIALEIVGTDDDDKPTTIVKAGDFPQLNFPPDHPTEDWFRKELSNDRYEMIYFATHGQSQSDNIAKIKAQIDIMRKKGKIEPDSERRGKMLETNLKGNSPLNSFLYLSSEDGDDIMVKPIEEGRDGCLTIKEIKALANDKFANTKYVILSACNTAVNMVPFAIGRAERANKKGNDVEISTAQIEKTIANSGINPDSDQTTFVETFLSRGGIEDVYASYWPVDDAPASIIMDKFIKDLTNMKDNPDPIKAYSEAQRNFLQRAKNDEFSAEDKNPEKKSIREAVHPVYWAVGAIFGK